MFDFAEESISKQTARFHLHYDIGDDVEHAGECYQDADPWGVAVVVGDHVGGGDVSALASDSANAIAEDIDRGRSHRKIQGIEHGRDATLVHPAGKGEDREARKVGRHDGEGSDEHSLSAAREIVIGFGVRGPAALEEADDAEGEEANEIAGENNIRPVAQGGRLGLGKEGDHGPSQNPSTPSELR